ncbi:hypothetical protein H8K90_12935 [Winogradskyella echinorum]|uniref:Uncharacterized protein n=1 Tax=Winogradskyella echinorum TaxID=538189 RepID=A0ABR6Y4X7_9FLAO|nr:hypothetical protein [Winogradskyella echinorum]MBC3847295.1 hypothetical protein [Winogradskyella echinorum]MBC5751643.1 hypothetical protein [Winogradskyella echinorum]
MKKRDNRHRLKEIRKENRFLNWLILCVGLVLFIVGLIKLLFFRLEIAVNARYLQPTVDNGGVICIAGFILLICSIYRFRNKEKVIKDTFDLEKDDL